MNLTQEEQDLLLKEAVYRYPHRCMFKTFKHNHKIEVESDGLFHFSKKFDTIYTDGGHAVYFNGQWAEIVPNESARFDPNAGNKPMDFKVTIDYSLFEESPRYKELLDEESKKRHCGNTYNEYKELCNSQGMQSRHISELLVIKLYAQRRYFIELLQEKDKEIERLKNDLIESNNA